METDKSEISLQNRKPFSPFGALSLIALAIAMLAAPARFERSVFLSISPGHALSVLDSLALLPLLTGIAWLDGGLWQRRECLSDSIRQAPGASSTAVFVCGLGLGLLIASAFSAFFWWWAVGATVFGGMLIAALRTVSRE